MYVHVYRCNILRLKIKENSGNEDFPASLLDIFMLDISFYLQAHHHSAVAKLLLCKDVKDVEHKKSLVRHEIYH
jgi:hypothetical protein